MNTLLITGATGFLGGAVLESILNKKNAPNLLLLVRADNSVAAVERVKENLRKFGRDAYLVVMVDRQIPPDDLIVHFF